MIQTQATKFILGFNIGTQYKLQKSFSNVEETVLFQKPFVGKKKHFRLLGTYTICSCLFDVSKSSWNYLTNLLGILSNSLPFCAILFVNLLCTLLFLRSLPLWKRTNEISAAIPRVGHGFAFNKSALSLFPS